jgi:hypothetical protein
MRFQNASEKRLCFRGKIVGAFKPKNGGFGATGPDMEFLTTIP